MTFRDLIPWGRQDHAGRAPVDVRERGESPLLSLHREVNRLFDDVLRGWDLSSPAGAGGGWGWPSLEVSETDQAVRVTAELPGLTERDVELSVDDGMLSIRGERRQESDERGYSERFYGRFERRVALPAGVDADKAEARFRDGVLTVTLPRSAEADNRRRIPIDDATRH